MESLAVRYRPQTFEEVTAQESIIKILKRQLELGQFKNTYLFCGASGCGKTTMGRIFAHEINKYVDKDGNICSSEPIEIDGASNNGVDNVKQIIKAANERSLDGKYKIYIIDECHSLTNQAWQAFLKCIEEPPQYTIFIFCTTDPQKIPPTILNRVMRFNFNRISSSKIKERLLYISNQEQYTNFEDACDYISRICNGQMRDGVALLEKCASYDTNLNINNVLNALGNYSYDIYFKLINYIIDGRTDECLRTISNAYNEGVDLKVFIEQFLTFCLDVSKYILTKSYEITKIPSNMINDLNNAINFQDPIKYYSYIVDKLLELKNMLKNDSEPRNTIEVMFMNMCRLG